MSVAELFTFFKQIRTAGCWQRSSICPFKNDFKMGQLPLIITRRLSHANWNCFLWAFKRLEAGTGCREVGIAFCGSRWTGK